MVINITFKLTKEFSMDNTQGVSFKQRSNVLNIPCINIPGIQKYF